MMNAQDPDDEYTNEMDRSAVPRYRPPDWISTDCLNTALWNAIADESPGCTDEDINNYDDSLDLALNEDDDDLDDEDEEDRQLTFRLLVAMRPVQSIKLPDWRQTLAIFGALHAWYGQ